MITLLVHSIDRNDVVGSAKLEKYEGKDWYEVVSKILGDEVALCFEDGMEDLSWVEVRNQFLHYLMEGNQNNDVVDSVYIMAFDGFITSDMVGAYANGEFDID